MWIIITDVASPSYMPALFPVLCVEELAESTQQFYKVSVTAVLILL